jgi:hypothetical protein
MVIQPKKEGRQPMLRTNQAADLIQPVRALNSMFLDYLQARLHAGGTSMGLPAPAAAALRAMSAADLERLAALPRSLFRLDPAAVPPSTPLPLPETALEQRRRALNLTILLTAAHAARRSDWQAQYFFGLSPPAQQRLLAWPLPAYARAAEAPDLLHCAFAASQALWLAWLGQPELPPAAGHAQALRCSA